MDPKDLSPRTSVDPATEETSEAAVAGGVVVSCWLR